MKKAIFILLTALLLATPLSAEVYGTFYDGSVQYTGGLGSEPAPTNKWFPLIWYRSLYSAPPQQGVYAVSYKESWVIGFSLSMKSYTTGTGSGGGWSSGHHAWYYTDHQGSLGNELGIYQIWGSSNIYMYWCKDCNLSTQRWNQHVLLGGSAHEDHNLDYTFELSPNGDVSISVYCLDDSSWLLSGAYYSRPSWAANFYQSSGWFVMTQKRANNDASHAGTWVRFHSLRGERLLP